MEIENGDRYGGVTLVKFTGTHKIQKMTYS